MSSTKISLNVFFFRRQISLKGLYTVDTAANANICEEKSNNRRLCSSLQFENFDECISTG